MFICRVCRFQQSRLFSSSSRALAAQPTQTPVQDALSDVLAGQESRNASRPPPRQNTGMRQRNDSTTSRLSRFQRSPARDLAAEQEQIKRDQAKQDQVDMERQMSRWWKTGDVYAPHDLSPSEMNKWKQVKTRGRQTKDVIDLLNINPVDHYKNFSVMSEYVTEMGRIKGRAETGLRPRNQRRMAKAIRRAVACGLMPSVYKHPELLRIEMERNNQIGPKFGRKRRG